MINRAWIAELAEAAQWAWSGVRRFWVQDVWPVLMTFGIFFVLAAPLIVVILILWYLDSIGWQASKGFYTIGAAAQALGWPVA